ncbi:hypothetical protein [Desulfosarcina ovata]|nr:hypothetical protein [Desulfosarcina ovata]
MTTSYVKPNHHNLKTIESLVVRVEGNPDFSHIDAIESESSIIILVTGPIGAIVDTAYRNKIDDDVVDEIKSEEILSSARKNFAIQLSETLQKAQFFDIVNYVDAAYNRNDYDAILYIEIMNWGSRRKQSESYIIIPFIDFHIAMTDLRKNKLIWNENQTVTYDTNHTLNDYKTQNGLIENDLEKLINKSANQIVELLLSF